MHGAADHRKPLGVGRCDDVAAVFIGKLQQHRLGVSAATSPNQELPKFQADLAPADARRVLFRIQQLDGLLCLALRSEHLAAHGDRR